MKRWPRSGSLVLRYQRRRHPLTRMKIEQNLNGSQRAASHAAGHRPRCCEDLTSAVGYSPGCENSNTPRAHPTDANEALPDTFLSQNRKVFDELIDRLERVHVLQSSLSFRGSTNSRVSVHVWRAGHAHLLARCCVYSRCSVFT
jgi:hypothetical protein